MVIIPLTHICVASRQWVNTRPPFTYPFTMAHKNDTMLLLLFCTEYSGATFVVIIYLSKSVISTLTPQCQISHSVRVHKILLDFSVDILFSGIELSGKYELFNKLFAISLFRSPLFQLQALFEFQWFTTSEKSLISLQFMLENYSFYCSSSSLIVPLCSWS